MIYLHDTKDIRQEKPSIVMIGKFDGFHRGHQKLLETAGALRRPGEQVVLFTFSRSPQMVIAGTAGAGLNTHEEKLRLAEKFGVDVLVEYPFTPEVRNMSAEDFLRDILLDQLCMKEIVAGPDCHFGHERRGDMHFLLEHAESGHYGVHVVPKVVWMGTPISSSRIREALTRGEVDNVAGMLGYRFYFEGPVVHGKQLGRSLGFPTINQQIPREKLAPAFGVYASCVELEGKRLPAISNVGRKPTIPGENPVSIETSIFDYQGDLYGRDLRVELLRYQRPERKFYTLDQLRLQVERDKKEAREYFRGTEVTHVGANS